MYMRARDREREIEKKKIDGELAVGVRNSNIRWKDVNPFVIFSTHIEAKGICLQIEHWPFWIHQHNINKINKEKKITNNYKKMKKQKP